MKVKQKQLLNITTWGDQEVRIELFGNGNYVLRENVGEWLKQNVSRIAAEVAGNLNK